MFLYDSTRCYVKDSITVLIYALQLYLLTSSNTQAIIQPDADSGSGPIVHFQKSPTSVFVQREHDQPVKSDLSEKSPSDAVCPTGPCVHAASENKWPASNASSPSTANTTSNVTHASYSPGDKGFSRKLNPEALMRGFYVFVGLSSVVLVYIAWKSIGRRKTRVHKYGVVPHNEDMEMAHLESDEGEDDDTTHFDIGAHVAMSGKSSEHSIR